VAWSGAGIDLKTGTPSPEQIRQAVRQLIVRQEFRNRAMALSESIGLSDALASIGIEVEEVLQERAGEVQHFSLA
jgi:UDP:flavonoid glycosyltransferase YjiC (YdhE family)